MAKYDGLIIPRSYNDYINKSDPAGVAQALQLTGVMDNAPTAQSTKPAKSGGIFAANAVIMANNKTLSGVAISAGSVVRVLFTAALTGSNATTGLTLTYNGNTYAVKVGQNGALANFLAINIDGSYIYCQAYTTLELMFDGTQFIIMGNPVVISSADYTIYTDGTTSYKNTLICKTSLADTNIRDVGYFIFKVDRNASNVPTSNFTVTRRYLRHYNGGGGDIAQELTVIGYDSYYTARSEQYVRGCYYDGSNYHFGNWQQL